MKNYKELSQLHTIKERYEYLKFNAKVGVSTFGADRYLNQLFYTSPIWRSVRDKVIIRDNGCDLGIEGFEILDKIIIHHMNPIEIADLKYWNDSVLLDPEYLICVTDRTHRAIHYGNPDLLPQLPIERRPGDTCPWR